eukprot:TRINITY_DN10372_c0_g1_i3.p1 TRINITY_DN10372_c0_g1~~TRINITY_DN10372_c0_g1_i3.p1  ORF type:complete len:737 (-),score=109.11 TRINITY_DN10372_c0_g1_i3:89-2299(-)
MASHLTNVALGRAATLFRPDTAHYRMDTQTGMTTDGLSLPSSISRADRGRLFLSQQVRWLKGGKAVPSSDSGNLFSVGHTERHVSLVRAALPLGGSRDHPAWSGRSGSSRFEQELHSYETRRHLRRLCSSRSEVELNTDETQLGNNSVTYSDGLNHDFFADESEAQIDRSRVSAEAISFAQTDVEGTLIGGTLSADSSHQKSRDVAQKPPTLTAESIFEAVGAEKTKVPKKKTAEKVSFRSDCEESEHSSNSQAQEPAKTQQNFRSPPVSGASQPLPAASASPVSSGSVAGSIKSSAESLRQGFAPAEPVAGFPGRPKHAVSARNAMSRAHVMPPPSTQPSATPRVPSGVSPVGKADAAQATGGSPPPASGNSPVPAGGKGDVSDDQWKNAFPAYLQSRDGHKKRKGQRGGGEKADKMTLSGEPCPDGSSNGTTRESGAGGGEMDRMLEAAKAAINAALEEGPKGAGPASKLPPVENCKDSAAPARAPSSGRGSMSRSAPDSVMEDPLWAAIRAEARLEADREPLLSSFLYASILAHSCFERSLGFVLANRLKNPTLLATQLLDVFDSVLMQETIRFAIRADVQAVKDRDPSCQSYSSALLYYKGYHAIQSYRIAHALWNRGQKVLALALQSRISEVFAVDIHPAARIGWGILMDHGTGVVIGETAVVGNRVSMLQGVTLGGTGKEAGDRHPKVEEGVLIGAGATILGNITIGKGAMVAAGSLVLKTVDPHRLGRE